MGKTELAHTNSKRRLIDYDIHSFILLYACYYLLLYVFNVCGRTSRSVGSLVFDSKNHVIITIEVRVIAFRGQEDTMFRELYHVVFLGTVEIVAVV